MVEFRIVSGDFGQFQTGQVRFKEIDGPEGNAFFMPGAVRVAFDQIQRLEKVKGVTQGWAGPGRSPSHELGFVKDEIAFSCVLKDSRNFAGICDTGAYTAIQLAVNALTNKPWRRLIGVALLLTAVALLSLVLVHVVSTGFTPEAGLVKDDFAPKFNEQALQLVTSLVVNDFQDALQGTRESAFGRTEALHWLGLDGLITSPNYDSEYEANEIAADNKFKGKQIVINGQLASINKDFTDEGYLVLGGAGLLGVRAQLRDQGTAAAASFRKGQTVSLVCVGAGRVLTVATLARCEPSAAYTVAQSPVVAARVKDILNGSVAANRSTARAITRLYGMALLLPAESPCLKGERQSCGKELAKVYREASKAAASQEKVKDAQVR